MGSGQSYIRKRTNRIKIEKKIETYFKELAHMLLRTGKSWNSLGQAESLELQMGVDVTI